MDSIFWLAATAAFGAVEAATTALVSVWFAVGSAAALIVRLFTDSLGAQFGYPAFSRGKKCSPGPRCRRAHRHPGPCRNVCRFRPVLKAGCSKKKGES